MNELWNPGRKMRICYMMLLLCTCSKEAATISQNFYIAEIMLLKQNREIKKYNSLLNNTCVYSYGNLYAIENILY